MKNDQKIQMADVSAICLPSAICRKSKQKRLFLDDKQPKNGSNENDCYLPSGIIFCHLDSIKSNNSNKNNSLQDRFSWQIPVGRSVLPSGVNPVTTGLTGFFSECCADPPPKGGVDNTRLRCVIYSTEFLGGFVFVGRKSGGKSYA